MSSVTKCDRCGSTESVMYAVVDLPRVDSCGRFEMGPESAHAHRGCNNVVAGQRELCSACAVTLGHLLTDFWENGKP